MGRRSRVALSPADRPIIPDYALLKEIGHGSYGSVWLARGLTGLYRAVKVIWRARFDDGEPYEREFRGLKEFAAVSANDGTLLSIFHVGRNDPAGFFYYVMELADDITTGRQVVPECYIPKTLAEVRRQPGRIDAERALDLGVGLARALAGLHDHGLVHRDVKPSNIVFVGNVPKFADIGLVRSTGLEDDSASRVGNVAYMPYDLPGVPSADVFGLGRVLYELSTGRHHTDFPCLPGNLQTLPDRNALLELNEVVLKACASNPAKRFPDARALLEELRLLQAGKSVRRMRTFEAPWRGARNVAGMLIGASAMVSLGAWMF